MEYLKKQIEVGIEEDRNRLKEIVTEIIQNVREKGDRALVDYNTKFDGNARKDLLVTREEIDAAYQEVDSGLINDMKIAARYIEEFAKKQKSTISDLEETEITPGVFLSHRVIPIESCCCYVPGGLHPLFQCSDVGYSR